MIEMFDYLPFWCNGSLLLKNHIFHVKQGEIIKMHFYYKKSELLLKNNEYSK